MSSLAGASGCAPSTDDSVASDESGLSETTEPRAGSTIQSPSVDPNKKYWGSRSIDRLTRLGYLTAEEASVAARADGILANSPPNRSIGVDELAVLESPEHSSSLFPEEKAVIPKLWKILEIANAQNVSPANATLNVAPTETLPTAETKITAATRTAQRVQLTCNSDGDATTLTSADIECAYADRDSYTPAEITELRALVVRLAAAGAEPKHSLSVPATSTSALFQGSGLTISANLVPSIVGNWMIQTPTKHPLLQLQPQLQLGALPQGSSVVFLDPVTGAESDARPGALGVGPNGVRVELWTGGQRVVELNLSNANFAQQPIPFGMPVTIGAQTFAMTFEGATSGRYVTGINSPAASQIPARAYRVEGMTDGRLYVFAQGYGRWITSSSSEICYPSINPQVRQVGSCTLFDANNRPRATFVFTPPAVPNDSPAIAHTTGALGDKIAVYPL